MPLLWLKVAVAFYALGLFYAMAAVSRPCTFLSKIVLPGLGLGMVFHFVSLAELAMMTGHPSLSLLSVHGSESLLAFLILAFFMLIYWRYRTLSPGLFVFPLVFLLTFASSLAQQSVRLESAVLRSGWLYAHIAMIFVGYAALVLSFGASILYLLQERSLKAKQLTGGVLSRLPALEVIDDIGYKSLLLGFPFMTFGLIAGSVLAQAEFGPMYFRDPKVVLSLLMWAVYMVLLYTRWSNGWRGRRAAYLATFAFLAAAGAWAANYFSMVHRFVAQ
jgi:ABC-type transport system involved in cytochrome c biogenesis permease subunit